MSVKCRNIGCNQQKGGECVGFPCGGADKSIDDLLALIHGDGGHYVRDHGKADAINEACEIITSLQDGCEECGYKAKEATT